MAPWYYYKHIMIVNDDSRVVNKWWVSLTDDIRVIIYGRNLFIIQATAGTKHLEFCMLEQLVKLDAGSAKGWAITGLYHWPPV